MKSVLGVMKATSIFIVTSVRSQRKKITIKTSWIKKKLVGTTSIGLL